MNKVEQQTYADLGFDEYSDFDYDKWRAEQDVLDEHHEQQFDNAKVLEFENRAYRKKIAADFVLLKQELRKVMKHRDHVEKAIKNRHSLETEQQALPNEKAFNFIGHEKGLSTKQQTDALKKELAKLYVL